jgi:16S rRNA (cytidine1402-2'-O)-methyltransferase
VTEVCSGTLFVVATPIGNLRDITLRALEVLAAVELVACEDTRRTAKLLTAHGIRARTTSCFEHNERLKIAPILDVLRRGRDVALVSDAGTPGISDPGHRLVRAAQESGVPVVPVPGPSASVAALSVSGLPCDRFLFVGFLPSRRGARQRALAELAGETATMVFYESPLRATATLDDMLAAFGDREAFLCREATKRFEEYRRASLSVLSEQLGSRGVRGEVVLVVGGAPEPARSAVAAPTQSVEQLYDRLAGEGRTRREAVKETARALGLSAREVYAHTQGRRPPEL